MYNDWVACSFDQRPFSAVRDMIEPRERVAIFFSFAGIRLVQEVSIALPLH